MYYILWGLLNLFLSAGFVVISFYAVKQLRVKFGLFVAILFTFMLLSFINQPGDKKIPQKTHQLTFKNNKSGFSFTEQSGTWHLDDSLTKYYQLSNSKVFTVYKTPLFSVNLHVQLATEPVSKTTVPVYAFATLNGTLAGINWEPHPPLVNVDDKGENLIYSVSGTMQWKLMNTPFFTSGKTFEGSIKLVE